MDIRDRIHHLSDLLSDRLEEDVLLTWKRNWPGLLTISCIIVLTGPLLVLAYKIQRWNVRSPWDTEDHWVGTKQFAVTFIGYDLFLLFAFLHFQTELSTFWFPTPWSWFFFCLIIWYVCFTLLSPTLALFFEHIDPQTRSLERMLLP